MPETIHIRNFQNHLSLIRKAAGWTGAEFAEKVGTTKQTISNLESRRFNLTKTMYIAMRYVLDEEIARDDEGTKLLQTILDGLVDRPEAYDEEARRLILKKAQLLVPAISTKTSSRKDASDEWMKGLALAGTVAGVAAILLGVISKIKPGAWKK